MIDTKGINLLDLGITSLRKELMNFVDNLFTDIRKGLLSDKLTRETYNRNKRLYQFYLSPTRLQILENGVVDIKAHIELNNKDIEEQTFACSKIDSEMMSETKLMDSLLTSFQKLSETLANNSSLVAQYTDEIEQITNLPSTPTFMPIDYDILIADIETEQSTIESILHELIIDKESIRKDIEKLNLELYSITEKINTNTQKKIQLQNEITLLDDVSVGTKCDKCGAIVTNEHKEVYKKEKYLEMDKLDKEILQLRNYSNAPTNNLIKKENDLNNLIKTEKELNKNLEETKVSMRELNSKKSTQIETINSISNEKKQRESDIFRLNSLINTYRATNDKLIIDKEKTVEDRLKIKVHIKELEEKLELENAILGANKDVQVTLQKQLQKSQEYLLKLKEAFKFEEYKYTEKDVLLYNESIKVLDDFAGYYINEWLAQLSVIINDLLKNVNMKVEFNPDKEFIKIKNGDSELKYEQLSSGQKTFLSAIFKLAILLHRGENEGIIICDEGLGNLDSINLNKFVEVCQSLPFQVFLIYQNVSRELEHVKYIEIIRKDGISNVQ
jgi:hypothetical protein